MYLTEYIQKVYDEMSKIDENIDLTYLKELVQTYYKRSLLSESEREERELI